MTKIVCGIDVSKDYLDAHVDGVDRQFSNNSTGLRVFGKWLHCTCSTQIRMACRPPI